MVQNVTSNGLLGLSHYTQSRVSMALMEPVYKNFFTIQIDLPAALGYDDNGTNLFLEEITKIGGLNTHKVEQAVTQGYKFSQRSFAQGKPNETTVDLTLDFEVNLDYSNDNRPSNFLIKTIRKWTDLIYDPLTGRSGLKKDYVADKMIVTMQDRAGTPYWQWVFYNVFPTTGIGDPGLDYNSTDLLKVTNFTLRSDYWTEVII